LGKETDEDPPAVQLGQIRDMVNKIMAQNPSVPVYLEADGANNYSKVMELMSTLESAGVPNVLLVTQPLEININ
jgi:biopolymer transport protein TolR